MVLTAAVPPGWADEKAVQALGIYHSFFMTGCAGWVTVEAKKVYLRSLPVHPLGFRKKIHLCLCDMWLKLPIGLSSLS